MHTMFDKCEGRVPQSDNRYPGNPIIGDVKFCVDRFASQPTDIKESIQRFVLSLLNSSAMKSLKGSRARLDAYLRRRFHLSKSDESQKEEKKQMDRKTIFFAPLQGGQSYIGQPTPSSTQIFHQPESTRGPVESAATQTNYLVEPDPVREPETQGTTINPSPYVRKVMERMAKLGPDLSLEAVEQVFDTELGYMNERTGQIFYSFEDFLQSLPSWEEFFSSKQWTYENVNHLLKQAGFRGRLSRVFTIHCQGMLPKRQ
jgi:hypothetical protein